MSIDDLHLILNKEAIIATYPAKHLAANPDTVERLYIAHARTHIPLGETERYVDTIFKWVGGSNLGAFIGAVVGNYGEGKTSFQIHVWDQSRQRKVFAVPPFSWERVADLIEGVHAWAQHMLCGTHPDLAGEALSLYNEYREKSLREMAEETARRNNGNVDQIVSIYEQTIAAGGGVDTQVSPENFLDFCTEMTSIVKRAGYLGLLVLLDEPEVAARKLGFAQVSKILFDLANGLLARQDDFGIFLSMPENFLSTAQSTFSSLPARLQARGCFPRLRDIYGADFAEALWKRYVQEFDLGNEGSRIVTSEALQAIGQVGSSERTDLSYGPRTVVSAFSRMVAWYQKEHKAYTPQQFIDDCWEEEVLVNKDYITRIKDALRSPESEGQNKDALLTLAAFPNGITVETAQTLGFETEYAQLAVNRVLVFKRGTVYGLEALRKAESGPTEQNELHNALQEIMQEFAPSYDAYSVARDAFIKFVGARLFEKRQGQQLRGWSDPTNWTLLGSMNHTRLKAIHMQGAFAQTTADFPRRSLTVAVGPLDANMDAVAIANDTTDVLILFAVRWRVDAPVPDQRITITPNSPSERIPGIIHLVLDLAGASMSLPGLEEIVDEERLTPLSILYLIGKMEQRTLTREFDAQWQGVREQLIRQLLERFFVDPVVRQQAREQIGQTIPGAALDLLGILARYILTTRYPNYSTLIRTPQWKDKVDDYIRALKNSDVPVACKRGREPWQVPGDVAVRALGTGNIMNLTGGFFNGFESLITIKSTSRKMVEVTFKLHPLEVIIRDQIMAEKPAKPLKIEGKECWWLPFEELKTVFLASGYLEDELAKIIEIGASRQTFQAGVFKGQQVIYCLPIDPEEMQRRLKDSLEALRLETEAFKQITGYQSSFDFDRTSNEINAVQDDNAFDKITVRIQKEHTRNIESLPGYEDRLNEDLKQHRTDIRQMREVLKSSPEATRIQTPPAGSSRWSTDLTRYIVKNLQTTSGELIAECETLIGKVDQKLAENENCSSKAIPERVQLIVLGRTTANDIKTEYGILKNKVDMLRGYLNSYGEWQILLTRSDDLSVRLVELKRDANHKAKAGELTQRMEAIWEDISNHLQTRNVNGLSGYQQFAQKFQEIEETRRTYLNELRSAFNKHKEKVESLYRNVGLSSDTLHKVNYNPDDIDGSYEGLHHQAAVEIWKALRTATNGCQVEMRELAYSRDVLGRIPTDDAQPLWVTLESSEAVLTALETEMKPEALPALLEDIGHQTEIKSALKRAHDAVESTRHTLRAQEPTSNALSPIAVNMLKLLEGDRSLDLKQVVLKQIAQGKDPAVILDETLECLSELFRYGKVQIHVGRPPR